MKKTLEKEMIQFLIKGHYLKGDKLIKHIKSARGNCYACQTCGYAHEDCVCGHNELLRLIRKVFKIHG